MSIRKLLIPLTLILASLFAPTALLAQTAPDLRHQEGVEVMEAQRAGLDSILTRIEELNQLAERATDQTLPIALRKVLDARFQHIMSEIHTIAQTQTNGWIVLNAAVWVHVQDSPGSTQSVVVHGVDVTPHALAINNLNLLSLANAWNALASLIHAKWYAMFGYQQNCLDLSHLGVDAGCGTLQKVCSGGLNSAGYEGSLFGYGTLLVGQPDQLTLEAEYCPFGSLGWFIMGQNAATIPFGSGTLCIDRSAGGLYRLAPATISGDFGWAALSLGNVNPALTSLIQPASNWYFQFLFKEPSTGVMNSTNALRVTFEP